MEKIVRTEKIEREPYLDLLRFLAATAVVMLHAGSVGYTGRLSSVPVLKYFVARGSIGVDVFFIISGYVIFKSAKGKTATKFILSRIIRLYPSLILIITSIFIFQNIISKEKLHITQLIKNVTLTFRVDPLDAFVPQLWTLVYEVKFYGAIALIILIIPKWIKNSNLFLILVFGYVMILFACSQLLGQPHESRLESLSIFSSYHLGRYGYLFAIGCCLSILKDATDKLGKFGSGILILISTLALYQLGCYSIEDFVVLVCSFIIILIPRRNNNSKLFIDISRNLGGVSYPLYLIHYHLTLFLINKTKILPIPMTALFLVSYAVTVLVSYVIYRYYEVPIQKHFKRKLTRGS